MAGKFATSFDACQRHFPFECKAVNYEPGVVFDICEWRNEMGSEMRSEKISDLKDIIYRWQFYRAITDIC